MWLHKKKLIPFFFSFKSFGTLHTIFISQELKKLVSYSIYLARAEEVSYDGWIQLIRTMKISYLAIDVTSCN